MPTFFGHPRGLATLFLTEFWERFSYYGMRALLILFMTASTTNGGLGFDTTKAAAIYGLYTASAYLAALPGGMLVDRLLGQRRGVLVGGTIIALGHFTMAIHSETAFYLALILIVTGTGLLKPGVTAMVGELYPEGGARRDAGFSIFYMGINLGATVAPLITGFLGQRIDWHLGFGMAGVGMVLGLVQYQRGAKHLGTVGTRDAQPADARRWRALLLGGVMPIVIAIAGIVTMRVQLPIVWMADIGGIVIVLVTAVYFIVAFRRPDLSRHEKRHLGAIAVFFVFSAACWSALEQAGSSLNLFAQRNTDLTVFGFAMPASWLQSVAPSLIIMLAPVFAWLWVTLSKTDREPTTHAKFVWGLLFISVGFALLAAASHRAASGQLVSPLWLVGTYLFHTLGELSFSPVGYSLVTKLSPQSMSSQLIGVWLTSISLGNLMAGRIAGQIGAWPMPQLFGAVAMGVLVAAVVLFTLKTPVRRLMGDVR